MPAPATSPVARGSASAAQDAIKKFSVRIPKGSPLNSSEWADVPVALRERAFFSAGVEHAETLQELHNRIAQSLALIRDPRPDGKPGGYMDRSRIIGDMRKILLAAGVEEGDGGLTDITSRRRLGLIVDTNKDQAFGYTNWRYDMDPDVLDIYPAQRLVRVEPRATHRDWEARWAEAGASVNWKGALQSPMVALKTSPIWPALSRFNTPWPPFDFGSGMGVDDIMRSEAEQLGLLDPGEQLQGGEDAFNASLAASVENIKPDLLAKLQLAFGDQIDIRDGVVQWTGGAA